MEYDNMTTWHNILYIIIVILKCMIRYYSWSNNKKCQTSQTHKY